ncbi:MAG: T6SS effector amidase Tae4 family protein [Hyphomicrobiaceae bacterium]
MATLDFDKLWRAHPLNNAEQLPCRLPKDMEVDGKLLLKGLPSYANQCAIRMGVCMHRAGITIGELGGVATCSFHGREEMHTLNAQQMGDAISRLRYDNLSPVEKLTGADAAGFYTKIINRRGFIFFKDYWARSVAIKGPAGTTEWVHEKSPTGDHVDLWNGYRTSANWLMEWFSWLGYYHTYSKSKEIWFWEIK